MAIRCRQTLFASTAALFTPDCLAAWRASTLAVVQGVKDFSRKYSTLPPALNVTQLFDQSLFVRAAVQGVVREASIAALLTALMILLFLAVAQHTNRLHIDPAFDPYLPHGAGASRETINVMTLGGLALAVGILVDDATVEIETSIAIWDQRQTLVRAILDGAQEIAVPASFPRCASALFRSSADAVRCGEVPVHAVAMAWRSDVDILSLTRTIVPTLVHYICNRVALYQDGDGADTQASRSLA